MIKKLLIVLIGIVAALGGAVGGEKLRGPAEAGADAGAGAHADAGGADKEGGHGDEGGGADDGHGDTAADAHATDDAHGAADDGHGKADDGHGGGDAHGGGDDHGETASIGPGHLAFPTQFFVPIVRSGNIGAIMILTLSLETAPGKQAGVADNQHRLRDALLRQLMIHANTGGFDGNFTTEGRMRGLRQSLLEAAQAVAGQDVTGVLIEDIGRQMQ